MRFCEADNCNQPVWGTCKISRRGYCKRHQNLREDFDPATILQKAIKKQRKNAAIKDGRALRVLAVTEPEVKAGKDYAELDRWFKERHKEMTGVCMNCGGRTEKDKTHYKCSVAHLLPKAYFKSVATHPDNWLELCFYNNSCHTNFDNKMIDLIDLHCFDAVIQKFVKIYPSIAPEERRRIPPILLEYLKTEL